ncbi:MAG: class I SAM-dependent methyltransferase [Mycobacteriales bacterium]
MTTDATWLASMPERYDTCLGPALFAPYAEHVARLAAALKPARVLELAAGSGIATAHLVAALPEAKLTATDLNAAMVEWSAQRVPAATWQTADAQALPFPPASFDLVVCQFGVMFFPDKVGAYAQMRTVLAPGGHVITSIWDTVDGSELTAALMECLAQVLPEDPPDFVVRIPHGYTDPDQLTADALAGGLVDVAVERVCLRGRAASAASVTEGFCLGTPLRFALAERGDPVALSEQLGRAMTERLGEGPLEGDLAAYVLTATCP